MASVHIASYVDMYYMFNINAGVGKNRPNQRLDVMLVQYLLKCAQNTVLNATGSTTSPIIPPELANEWPIKTDGICGPKTLRYIAYYQEFRNSHTQHSAGNNMNIDIHVARDGAIDPWTYPVRFSVIYAGSPYLDRTSTLVALCYDAAKSSEFQSGSFSTMPSELKQRLMAH